MLTLFPQKTTPIKAASRKAKPFLKWVGGKQQLLTQFEPYFPTNFDRYIEPFVGSGAVFFHLWNTNRLPQHLFLFDHNEELINVYRVVRDNLDALVELLSQHKENHSKEYYYQIRNLDREAIVWTDIERAARTIYLNKTCYNGLYRVNRKGQFNVPMGRYKNPGILQPEVLTAANAALQNVSLEVWDFRQLLTVATVGDFIYFDPPYDPLSKTANFTSYTASNFSDQDQRDLADLFTALTTKGCRCMLSNAYTEFILKLYENFRIEVVFANRAVNSKANNRGRVKEVVILNF